MEQEYVPEQPAVLTEQDRLRLILVRSLTAVALIFGVIGGLLALFLGEASSEAAQAVFQVALLMVLGIAGSAASAARIAWRRLGGPERREHRY
jgi:hypothetical protein